MENRENPFADFEVISTYSRAQALEDGVLVDVSQLAKEAGFLIPVAVTRAVFAVLDPGEALAAEGQSFEGRAWDMLTILRFAARAARNSSEVGFSPLFVMEPGRGPKPLALRSVCGPGDDAAAPVITVMLPNED
jgi:hypothetical protein